MTPHHNPFGEPAATDGCGRRRRGRGDRGAVMIEFALTMPLLVMILLGMFTGGLAWNQKLAVTNGVREGSRFGATLSVSASTCSSGTAGTVGCWLSEVATVTQSSAEGELSTEASRNVCVALISVTTSGGVTTTTTTNMTRDSGGDHYGSSTCFSDGRTDSRVQVTASRLATLEFMLFTLTPTLSSQSVSRFEAS